MKKLIIAIIAMATVAIAASKPVCKETEERGWEVMYTCMRPVNDVKKISIGVYKNGNSFSVTKIMKDESKVSSDVFFNNVTNETYVTEYSDDDLGVRVHYQFRSFAGNQFLTLYTQLRDKYDLQRKK